MTAIPIPSEALEAADRAYGDCNCPACKKAVRRVAEALLKAWPGMDYRPGAVVTDTYRDPGKIILPITPSEERPASS